VFDSIGRGLFEHRFCHLGFRAFKNKGGCLGSLDG